MSLIYSLPPTPTPAQAAHARIVSIVNQCYAVIGNGMAEASQLFWGNANGSSGAPTPIDMATEFGTDAVQLFTFAGLATEILGAPSPVPAGWTVTANADGSVTLTPPALTSNASAGSQGNTNAGATA